MTAGSTCFVPLLDRPSSEIAVTLLHRDRLVFACAPEHPLASRQRIHLRELTRQPFVDSVPARAIRQLVDRAFAAAGVQRRVAIELNDVDTCLEMVRRGVGVTIVPESASPRGPGVAFRPLARKIEWELFFAHHADGPGNPVARELLRRVLSRSEAREKIGNSRNAG